MTFADTLVLFRTTPHSFAITGWGWIVMLFVLTSIKEMFRRDRKRGRRHDWQHEFDFVNRDEGTPDRVMTCSVCGRQERVSISFVTNDLLNERTCRG